MRSSPAALFAFAALALSIASAPVRATKPHNRDGFFFGAGFGVGITTWDWTDPDLGGNPSEPSEALSARAGTALRNDLVLGVELQGWAKRWTIETSTGVEIGKTTVSFASASVAVTYFPGNKGAFVRGALGAGMARTEMTDSTATALSVAAQTSDFGPTFLGAIGYELRVTDHFALGLQGEVVYLIIDGDVITDPFVMDGGIQFNWYW